MLTKVSGNQILRTKRLSTQIRITKRFGKQAPVSKYQTRTEQPTCLQNDLATKTFCRNNGQGRHPFRFYCILLVKRVQYPFAIYKGCEKRWLQFPHVFFWQPRACCHRNRRPKGAAVEHIGFAICMQNCVATKFYAHRHAYEDRDIHQTFGQTYRQTQRYTPDTQTNHTHTHTRIEVIVVAATSANQSKHLQIKFSLQHLMSNGFDTQSLTQTRLHTESFYSQKVTPHNSKAPLRPTLEIYNFTSNFDDRTSFRAKGLPRRMLINYNFTAGFDDRTSFSCEMVAFRGASLALPPALREKNRKQGDEKRQEGKRAKGRQGKRARCENEDGKM